MDSFQGHGDSTDISNSPKGSVHLEQTKAIHVIMEPCGLCEGCKVTEGCTKCENCIKNYIQTAIENYSNPNHLTCLKRMCLAGNIVNKREIVTILNNSIEDEQEIRPSQSYGSISEVSKLKLNPNEIKMEESLMLNEDKQTETEVNMKLEKIAQMKEKNKITEQGGKGFNKTIKLDDSFSMSDVNDGREASMVEMQGRDVEMHGREVEIRDRELVFTKDLTQTMICQKKKGFSVKEVETDEKDKIKMEDGPKVHPQRRKRCGTCLGCVQAENCDNCNICVRREKARINGARIKEVCNARKCHDFKIPKNKKIDEMNLKPLQSDKIYGLGIKIKSKASKLDMKIDQKKTEDDNFDDFAFENDSLFADNDSLIDLDKLSLDQIPKHTKVENWLSENVQPKEKSSNSKTVKRTKKCGECSNCQAEDCGHCRSCQINNSFSDSLILGKVPCLTNRCESPVELGGDMNSMMQQDDSSNGTVCPVKIVNGVLYDFRCFFCKKLPRAGSANRSELMRHYSVVHFANELRKDYEIFMIEGHCLLCNMQMKGHSIPSHIGQKHNEVVNYLPSEAVSLCPEDVQKETGRRHPKAAAVSSKKTSGKVLNWPTVPEGFDPSSEDRNWKGSSSSDSGPEMDKNFEIVDGWIIEHVTNSNEELPSNHDRTLDYSGVGGRCRVCEREFEEVSAAAVHLHEDHDIQGGSSYIMKDCQNFIKSGYIQVSKVQNVNLPATIDDKADEKNSMPSHNSNSYLDFQSKRYVARKSTNQKSRASSTPAKKQMTCGKGSQWITVSPQQIFNLEDELDRSSHDEEDSSHCDESEMEVEDAM